MGNQTTACSSACGTSIKAMFVAQTRNTEVQFMIANITHKRIVLCQ